MEMVKNSFSFFGVVILAVTYWYWSNRNSDKIQKEKWFEAITGCTEAQFRNLEKNLLYRMIVVTCSYKISAMVTLHKLGAFKFSP
jgi:hypothetical protein